MRTVAAVDIGGTKTAVGLVTEGGRLLHRLTAATPAAEGPTAVLDTAVGLLGELDEQTGGQSDARPVAVGVGSAGVIDPRTGRVTAATDALRDWAGTPLRAELTRRLGLPVAVDNDVHAHALGEAWQGAARGRRDVLLVAVGTGVGGSLLLDGRVHHGAHQVAGHFGHLPVPAAAGRICGCGGHGHVEAVACGPALWAEYRRRAGSSADAEVTGLADVAARAAAGEELAAAVLAEGATALGQAIGGLANAVDPSLVLVTGGVSHCGESWWRPLRTAIVAQLLAPLRELPVEPGQLDGSAALFGAARLALDLAPTTEQAKVA